MNCPNCGVSLMAGMKVCPKCKWDNTTKDGGPAYLSYIQKQEEQKAIEAMSEEEKEKIAREAVRETFKPVYPGSVYHIKGVRGRVIDIFPHKCIISVNVTIGSVLTSNATDGEKTIYYGDCIGIQYKPAGLTLGFLQLETAAGTQNNSASNFFNENTFTFDLSIPNSEMSVVVDYVKEQVEKIKIRQYGNGID